MKPFDLKKALAGEPVKLRNGMKAYIKYNLEVEPCFDGNFPLQGYFINNGIIIFSWSLKGEATSIVGNEIDIVGMWEEPRPRVQLDLPCPLKKWKPDCYLITDRLTVEKTVFTERPFNEELCLYFDKEEYAEEWINAMKQSKR